MSPEEVQTQAKIDDLFLQLLACLEVKSPELRPSWDAHSTQEVILDTCIDGSRYILTRYRQVPGDGHISLSPREKEIIRLVCVGLPNKAISHMLEISPWTVGTYLKRIFAKLDVNSRAEMVACVLREGLLNTTQQSGGLAPDGLMPSHPENVEQFMRMEWDC